MSHPDQSDAMGARFDAGEPMDVGFEPDQDLTVDATSDSPTPADVAATAQSEAKAVADVTAAAGEHVLQTAKEEGAVVLEEVKFQGRQLLQQSGDELRTQAATGQRRFAELGRALGDELQSMADASPDGMLAQYVGRAQRLTSDAADWLDSHEPEELLQSVRSYAARNPWQFLAISAGVGFIGARIFRGLKDADTGSEATRGASFSGGQVSGGYTPAPATGSLSTAPGSVMGERVGDSAPMDTTVQPAEFLADDAAGWGESTPEIPR